MTLALRAPLIFAHLGHWYIQLMYVAPVAVLVGLLSLQSWREGRAERKNDNTRQ